VKAVRIVSIVILGDTCQCGSYILRIKLKKDTKLAFGRFKKGRLISVPSGDYIYVGSANAKRGATSLGRRLVRHATRSGKKRHHPLRRAMVRSFNEHGVGEGNLLSAGVKHRRWNVDYLLDLPAAELMAVFVLRTDRPLEAALAELIEADPKSRIIEKGLGANDNLGRTHLLQIDAGERWWSELPDRLSAHFKLEIRLG
jgi:Uri superfamily endonuclease